MDFLTRLAQRTTGALPTVQPRLPARFESTASTRPGTVYFSEVAVETSPPYRRSPAPRMSMIEHPQPGQAVFEDTQPAHPTPSAKGPPPATIAAGARPEAQRSHQSHAVLPTKMPLGQHPPTIPGPAAKTIQPLYDLSIRPAPQPRPALRVDARSAHAVAAGPQRSETQPPAGGHLIAEAVTLETAAPTVHVRIGRIDVRAIMPPAPPPRPAARPVAPRSSLEDYLSGRQGGPQP